MDHEKYKIIVKDAVKVYSLKNSTLCGGKNESYKIAVKGVSFGVEKGTVFSLLGTNGAGKSTIFKMLTGNVYPSMGEAYIQG